MKTFRPGDFAYLVKQGQQWLPARRRVHVVAVLHDGRIRYRDYDGQLKNCRLSDLEHVTLDATTPSTAVGDTRRGGRKSGGWQGGMPR